MLRCFIRSNPALCGMCRNLEPKGLMSRQLDARLSNADRLAVEQVLRKLPDGRVRERAKTLLLLSQPLLNWEVAKLQDLNIETLRLTWQRRVKEGIEALCDKDRSVTPRKLDATGVERLLQWVRQETLCAAELRSAILKHSA